MTANPETEGKNREEEVQDQQQGDAVIVGKKRQRGGGLFCFKAVDILHRINR